MEITTNTTEIQKIVRNYYEELYTKKFENLDEMDKFLEKFNLPKQNEGEAGSLKRPITADKIEVVIKKLPINSSIHAIAKGISSFFLSAAENSIV